MTRTNGSRILVLLVSGAVLLSACTTLPSGPEDLSAQRDADVFDQATIDAIGDKVADWQLANLDDLSYIRNYEGGQTSKRRGWVHGALFVGMMNWAALPGNDRYFATLREFGEENEWLATYSRKKLAEKHRDYFVFGHRHLPLEINLENNSKYINLGDWITYYTYGVFDGEDLVLKDYK